MTTDLPYPFNLGGPVIGYFDRPGEYHAFEQRQYPGATFDAGTYGRVVPLSQGKRKVIGAPIWASVVRTTTRWLSSGAGLLPGETGNGYGSWALGTDRTYTRDFAVAFGYALAPADEYPEPKILRMWVGGVLVHDATNPDNVSGQPMEFTFYTGTEAQLPDATMVADAERLGLPADSVPAYRGMMYIVFKNFVVLTQNDSDAWKDLPPETDIWTRTYLLSTAAAYRRQNWDKTAQQVSTIPTVMVELADGHVAGLTNQPFTEQVGAQRHYTGTATLANWYDREILTFPQVSGQPDERYISFWDIDGRAMTRQVPITGDVGGSPYVQLDHLSGAGAFQCIAYDPVSRVLFTSANSGNSVPLVTIDVDTGNITSVMGVANGHTAPKTASGGDPRVDHEDVHSFLYPVQAAVAYPNSIGNQSKAIFAFGGFISGVGTAYFYVVAPDDSGALPADGPWEGLVYLPDADGVAVISPMPTELLNPDPNAPQDAIFIVGNGNNIVQVFVTTRQDNDGVWKSEVYRTVNYEDAIPAGWRFKACTYDNRGLVLFYHDENVGGTNGWRAQRRQFQETTLSGFNGKAYGLASVPAWDVLIVDPSSNGFHQTSIRDSLNTGPSFCYFGVSGPVRMNLSNGSTDTVVAYPPGYTVPLTWVYNGTEDAFYASANSVIDGGGLTRHPLNDASDWEAQEISDYLRWLALRAGYQDGSIEVDTELTDPTIGIYMDIEWSFSDLFTNFGRLYDFQYFLSEGKIKFQKQLRNPVKATGTLTWSGNPSDNDTVVIGSQTYRFKNALALPFDVKIGANATATKASFEKAVNLSGVAGTDYTAGTTISEYVVASALDATRTTLTAIHGGTGGNSIGTTETSASLSFGSITLTGGQDAASGDEIDKDEMAPIGTGGDNEVLITTLGQMSEVANKVQVKYFDIGRFYEYNTTIATGDSQTNDGAGNETELLPTPLVMTDSEANRRATKLNFRSTEMTLSQEFRLPWRFLAYEPTDVVTVTVGQYRYVIKLDEVTLNGDWSISLNGANFATGDNITVPDMPPTRPAQTGVPNGDSVAVIVDGPNLTPIADPALIIQTGVRSYGQSNFSVASLVVQAHFDAPTDYPASIYNTSDDVPSGIATVALPATDVPWTTDETTELIVSARSITQGHVQTVTDEEFLAGANMAIVGKPGRWEYIYFRDVEWVSSSAVKLTVLTRGRRGTEVNCNSHQAGDDVYIVAATGPDFVAPIRPHAIPSTEEGAQYRYFSAGFPTTRAQVNVDITVQGQSLFPFAPTGVTAELVVGDDVELNWLRRDRAAANDWVTEDVPLSEASEAYELEILDGVTVVRTVTGLTSPTYTYSAANQVTDGFTTPMASIKVRVYQVGALGRGFPKEITVDVE